MNIVARWVVVGSMLTLAACGGGGDVGGSNGAAASPVGLAGVVQLSAPSYSVSEGAASAAIVVARIGGTEGSLSVTLNTSNGTATAGQDYASTSTTLTFAAGDAANKTVNIPITSDGAPEPDETLTVTLTSSALGTPSTATVTIQDDDPPGALQLSRSTFSVGEAGGVAEIGVTRTGGSSGVVTVSLATHSSTAMAGQDYSEVLATVTFADGDTEQKTVGIPILDDADPEGDETFTLVLLGPTGRAALGAITTSTVTISGNDQPPPPPAGGLPGTLQLSSANFGFGESAGNAIITVTRVGGSGGVVGATIATSNGTAAAGSDYLVVNTTVSFASGDTTSKLIPIQILNDSVAEPGESFTVTLSAPTGGASLGTPTSATLSIQDNDSPLQPTLSLSTNTKQIHLSWSAIPTTTAYKLYLNPDGASGFTQVGADLTAATTSTDVDIAVHHFDWPSAMFRLEACNAIGCTGSASIGAFSGMLQAIGYFKEDAVDSNDHLGASVAVSADGNTIAVGAPGEDSNAGGVGGNPANNAAANSGAVYVFARTGGVWAQQAYLKANTGVAGDAFGTALALSNDGATLAVGAPNRSGAGTVDAFVRSGAVWSRQATLVAASAGAADRFGASLALSGDGNTIAVGATGEDSNAVGIGGSQTDESAAGSGAAYVYARSGAVWSAATYVKATNTQAGDQFGSALALSSNGNVLAIGAIGEASAATTVNGDEGDNTAPGAGAVYLYARSGGIWAASAYVKAPNAEQGDRFGGSVTLSADAGTLAVGAVLEDGVEVGPLTFPLPPPPTPDPPPPPPPVIDPIPTFREFCDQFPAALGCNSGAVYVFTGAGSTWTPQIYLKSSNNEVDDGFGTSISLSADGNELAVGAVGEDSGATGIEGDQTSSTATDAGAVYVFSRAAGVWSQRTYVKASNSGMSDAFGAAVALSPDGASLIVGATGEASNTTGINGNQNDDSASGAGAAYLY